MKNLFNMAILILAVISFKSHAQANAFTDELRIFSNYLGNWTAVFKSENGVPTVVDVSSWERALNGKALRTLHSINQGEYGGESLIFFDKTRQKIVFYYFTTADFFTQGTIEVLSDNSFVAYEDVIGNSDGITQVKSTSTLMGDTMKVSTSYLKNEQWTAPEHRTYVRSQDAVVFK